MGFKESLAEDLETTFFNLEEFADVHRIDGKKITSIVQSANSDGAARSRSQADINPKENAVQNGGVVVYAMEKDIRKKLTVNALLDVDGARLFVQDVQRIGGAVRIVAGRNMV